MRKTLNDLYATRLPQRLNLCEGDERMLALINTAQDRLMSRGSWWGTTARFKVCLNTEKCLAWPREVETILGAKVCKQPMRLRHEWYSFSEYVTPEMAHYPIPSMDDLGEFPIVSSHPAGDYVKAYAIVAGDVGKTITIHGLDDNNVEAEEDITLSIAGTVSTTAWNEITAVQKEVTTRAVLLYSWDGATQTALLGRYQPSETTPTYRWSKLAGCGYDGSTLEVLAKLRHVPVSSETDLLIIQNTSALMLAVESLVAEENGKNDEAELKWQKAIRELKHELATKTGNTSTVVLAPYGHVSFARKFEGFI